MDSDPCYTTEHYTLLAVGGSGGEHKKLITDEKEAFFRKGEGLLWLYLEFRMPVSTATYLHLSPACKLNKCKTDSSEFLFSVRVLTVSSIQKYLT